MQSKNVAAENDVKTYKEQMEVLQKDVLFMKLDIKSNMTIRENRSQIREACEYLLADPCRYWKAIHLILGTVDTSLTYDDIHGSGTIHPYRTTSSIFSRLLSSLDDLPQKHEHNLPKTNKPVDQEINITPVLCDETPSFDYFNDYVKSFGLDLMEFLQADETNKTIKNEIWLIVCSLKSKVYEVVDVNGNELATHLPGFCIPDMIMANTGLIPVYSLFTIECKTGPLQTFEEARVHAPQLLRECIFCASEYGVLTNSIDYWFFKFELDPNNLSFGKTGKPESRYFFWHCPPVNSPIPAKMMICLLHDIQLKKRESLTTRYLGELIKI
ncbi:unnamed protein product [Ambrosiozyma monospora]|uniref:Unnamed protein product n=1 Tax=Ambrosiozyma monospora TaxID=43982 RepID=A0ACB5SVZ6_AMBMO|nr:unnamed protein product [Ambrosiozyma monospora]